MFPAGIADVVPRFGRRLPRIVAGEPLLDVEEVDLLCPEHAGQRLALHQLFVGRRLRRMDGLIEIVGLFPPCNDRLLDAREGIVQRFVRQPEVPHVRSASGNRRAEMEPRLRAVAVWIHARLALDEVAVERVFDVRRDVRRTVEPLVVRFVVREDRPTVGRAVQMSLPELVLEHEIRKGIDVRVVGDQRLPAVRRRAAGDDRLILPFRPPAPGVAKPELGEQVERSGGRPAIARFDTDADVFRPGLRVFDEHVEVTILLEGARVEQLEFHPTAAAPAVLVDQPRVRILGLRILVEHLHVRAGRQRVEVEVVFLHVLAAVAFARRQTEHPFLQNRIAAVPERQRERQDLIAIAQPRDSVFAPSIRPAACVVVRHVIPRVAARAVILAYRSPRAFRDVAAPPPPLRNSRRRGVGETVVFRGNTSVGRHVCGVLSAGRVCAAIFPRMSANSREPP
jgi:hypothetical protein